MLSMTKKIVNANIQAEKIGGQCININFKLKILFFIAIRTPLITLYMETNQYWSIFVLSPTIHL